MKVAVVGHGEPALMGRLFFDTNSLREEKGEERKSACKSRDKGEASDVLQICLKSEQRDYVIIDASGHQEFSKSMVSGAANSEAAILLIDASIGIKGRLHKYGDVLKYVNL